MFPESVTRSSLWLAAFNEEHEHSELVHRLMATLTSMRAKSDQLSSLVRSDFPSLTAHDISHLDALWEVGSTICGGGYPLNPLEAFILGAAILLHDSALSFSAYEGGEESLRKTTLWKDHFSYFDRLNTGDAGDRASDNADFATIRDLHAKECQSLAVREWRKQGRPTAYLIDDTHLREHFGHLVGQVASSHHWSIEDAIDCFSNQTNPTGDFPSNWVVHPIKLACILRCADAGHIDGRRAPDFLLNILARNRVSQDHWVAQNLLSRLCEYEADQSGETLTINSTRPYRSDEASAWWVAKDAIDVLSQELVASNNALSSYNRLNAPEFKAKQILGSNDVILLSRTIKTDGWKPTEAMVKVSNVEAVVSGLGGAQLYDKQTEFGVALRELIQNSRDAIKARAIIEPSFTTGSVRVSLERLNDSWVLQVEDNGIGMSERVLTGHLLDFGSSFWKSGLVQSEWPGLLSSDFRSMGKFGIGFFSVFMVADSVSISSRRYSSDLSSYRTLHFRDGMSLRPLLSSETPLNANTNVCTQVRLVLKENTISSSGKVRLIKKYFKDDRKVPFYDFLAATTALLDVDVYHEETGGRLVPISRTPSENDNFSKIRDWVSQLNAHEYGTKIKKAILKDRDYSRFRNVYDNGKCVGLAALGLSRKHGNYHSHGMVGVSGLISLDDGGNGNIFGGVSISPSGAARAARTDDWLDAIDVGDARNWISKQIELLSAMEIPLEDLQDTIQHVVMWGYDAYPIWKENQFLWDGKRAIIRNSELVDFCAGRGIYFSLNADINRNGKSQIDMHNWFSKSDYRRNFEGEVIYVNGFNSMSGDSYWNADFEDRDLALQNCLISYFFRFLTSAGLQPEWKIVQRRFENEDGEVADSKYLHLSF